MKSILKCPICNNSNLYKIKVIEKSEIFECGNCNLCLTNSLKKADLYYSDAIYNFDSYKFNEEIQDNKFKFIISQIKPYILNGKLLDVGAGYGHFSQLLSANKNIVIDAIEPHLNVKYAEGINNIKVLKTSYQNFLSKSKNIYKAAFLLDVLEHFPNPDQILKSTRKIIEENGYVVINLPNYKSLMTKICKNWAWWMVEDHYVHFSPKSIKKILIKNGFSIINISTYENLSDFKKNLDGNFATIENKYLRKIIKLIFYSMFFTLYFIFHKLIWKLGKGGLILVIARKI